MRRSADFHLAPSALRTGEEVMRIRRPSMSAWRSTLLKARPPFVAPASDRWSTTMVCLRRGSVTTDVAPRWTGQSWISTNHVRLASGGISWGELGMSMTSAGSVRTHQCTTGMGDQPKPMAAGRAPLVRW